MTASPAPLRLVAGASKGEATRAQILAAAVEQASVMGFESLTIGSLAQRTGLSKSGLFAHFGSKLELQLAALDEAARQYGEAVFLPALKAPRGVRRLRAIFGNWAGWREGGCPVDAASREYEHRPGPMRDAIVERLQRLDRELRRAVQLAVDTGELASDTDVQQFALDFVGLMLVLSRGELIMGHDESARRASEAFEQLVRRHAA